MFGLDASRVVGLGLTLKAWAFIVAGALVLAGAVYAVGYANGGSAASATAAETARKVAAGVAADRLKQQEALGAANERYRQAELDHGQEVAQIRADFAASQSKQQAQDAATLADLRSGAHRLRLQVAACHSAQAGAPGPGSGGVHEATYAELAPETSAALYGIAAEGDDAIRELTGLQAWATSAVKLCSGVTKP